MKGLYTLVYTASGVMGLLWATYLTLTGVYGVPFSAWYAAIFVGGILVLVGAVLVWLTKAPWPALFAVAGSSVLTIFFTTSVVLGAAQMRLGFSQVGSSLLAILSLLLASRDLVRRSGRQPISRA
jgi:hypothetical protein